MTRTTLAALVAAVLMLTACEPDVPEPGESKVDVGTPELVELKAETDVPDCAPGETTDGGLPDLTLACLGGGPDVDLSTLEGPLVVNLWASWCKPCREEMPVLQAFNEQYGDQVPVLGIDYLDTQPAAALELAKEVGVTYPLVADPGGDINGLGSVGVVKGQPWFLFVAEDGDVSASPGGASVVDSVDDLVDLANEHLGTDL
jgi:thiol-disulfide isomerase/thioredoxin